MKYNQNLDRTKKYAAAFWNHDMLDRPYTAVTALKNPVPYSWTPVKSYYACMEEKYDGILAAFENLAANTYYAGEALPNFEITLGPDQYAAFLGGELSAAEGDYTTWAKPVITAWEEFEAAIDKSCEGYYRKVEKFMKYAAKAGEGRYLLNMLDLHSGLDVMSALRGAQDLCYDIMDEPELVKKVMNGIRKTYRDIYRMAYEAGDMERRGTIGWAPIYCEGKSAVLQCDFSCFLSPAQGEEFFLDAIREEAQFLDHCTYHLDGKDALVHLDHLLQIPEIDCIQWVPGDGQPKTYEWMDVLKKIQASGKAVWIYDWTADDIKRYYKELRPDRVAFSLSVQTPGEADELLEYLVKHS